MAVGADIKACLAPDTIEADHPQSYNDLLEGFSSIHLVAVFGEDDNTFQP